MIAGRALGRALPPARETPTPRRLLAFAAGVGDTTPAVFDDLGELVAPPAFCVSLEWPVLSHPEAPALLGAEPADLLRGVHAVQDSLFHRPIRPGVELTTSGAFTGLRATRAGALVALRLETADAEGPVVTSWAEVLYRGVALDGEGGETAAPPAVPEPPSGGAPERVALPIARELPHVYTECARIWNPIHTERRVALAAGLPDIILHGTASWALAGREISARHAGGDPARLRRLRGRFRAMVIPGTKIELEQRAAPLAGGATGVWFRVCNADGEDAVADGYAEIHC